MVLYAVDDIVDAGRATWRLLVPFELGTWLRFAVIAFFIGGVGATNAGPQFSGATPMPGEPAVGDLPVITEQVWLAILAAVGLVLALVLILLFVGAVMEFVFVESLRTERPRIRAYSRRHWRQGFRLFQFRLALALLTIAAVTAVVAPVAFTAWSGGSDAVIAALLLALPVLAVFFVAVAVVNGFTTVFVVPIMLRRDCGVRAGWRALWRSVKTDWKQYLAYMVLGAVLSFVLGVLVTLATVVVFVVLLLPFGLLFGVAAAVFLLFEPAGIAAFAVVGLLFGVALLVAVALVNVPAQAYLRYYALFVLGDIDPAFDVVSDQRAAVRE